MDGIDEYNKFVALHKSQLEISGIPHLYWKSLFLKLSTDSFDAGEAFQLMLIDYDDEDNEAADITRSIFALSVARETGIKVQDTTAIYLIDHAWTFRMQGAREQLQQYTHLTDRLCVITGVDLDDGERIDKVMRLMWKYCHSYSLSSESLTDEERMPIWYILDEVGCAVNHSDEPNFKLVPFFYLTNRITYTLLFPLRDCVYQEHVTRDFVEYIAKDKPERPALLLPWRSVDLRGESFLQTEPEADYFSCGHIPESHPTDDVVAPQINRNEPLKVYAEYDVLREFLTDPSFELVDDRNTADVLWLTHHYKEFAELSRDQPNKFVNQFPFEYVITIKDLLSIICRRTAVEHHNASTLETYPLWLPTTYNLKTEIVQFVSYFQQRETKGLDNHWIVKPWNLARSLDTHISDNISQIMRLPSTGPKIAQKYIERPVLFHREDMNAKVKFDVRYVVLAKSVKPLEAYIYRNFFLRFANKPFSLDHLDDYEKHFTVMNYAEEVQLHHVKCEDFLRHWSEQYPTQSWTAVENDICDILHEVFVCATKREPPCGMTQCPQSRALYAADIMLEWSIDEQRIQPKLLEINWTPDCKRACDYYPEFFNDIFKLLFLGENNEESFTLLEGNKTT